MNANKPSSSENSGSLKIDFYESGIGDTIIITFPSGGIGIVDAHPSPSGSRLNIEQIIAGKTIHFVCLTHPHEDHGRDLIPVLENHPDIKEFWSTHFDIPNLVFGVREVESFPSAVREHSIRLSQHFANFLIDLFGAVAEHNLRRRTLHSELRKIRIDGVDIHCIGPDEAVLNSFDDLYKRKLTDPDAKAPDINSLSAILVLKYGSGVVVLGGDALKRNWDSAIPNFIGRNLPKAQILKVPHHGARNSYNFGQSAQSYLDICSSAPAAKAILFAGDSKHPNTDVYSKLRERSDVFCLSNGTRSTSPDTNPLGIAILGARAVHAIPVCNALTSFEVASNGTINLINGDNCEGCPLAS